MRYLKWTEESLKGLKPQTGITLLYIEAEDNGMIRREVGVNDAGVVIHKCPSDKFKDGTYGVIDNVLEDISEYPDSTTKQEFETQWKK